MDTSQRRHTDQDTYDFLINHMGEEDGDRDDGRWNSIFETEPTKREVEEWVNYVWHVKHEQSKKAKDERRRAAMKKHAPELVKGMLITMSIDQRLPRKEINKVYCEKIITELSKISLFKEYEYLVGRALRFEFWTEGEDGKPHWNPHFHINVETTKQKGKIAQPLERKFVKDSNGKLRKWNIWCVDATPREADRLEKYVVDGDKANNKIDYVAMDNEYKRQNNIEEIYII